MSGRRERSQARRSVRRPFVEALRGAARLTQRRVAFACRSPAAGRPAKSHQHRDRAAAGASGQPTCDGGNIIIIEDVTERVHLEEQLQISDRMASVGLLAAGVAHEVNTPLTGISSFTQMLLSNADPDDPRTRMLEKIEQQTFRAAKIVNGLLNLSRSGGSSADEVRRDLNAVISDVLSLLGPQLVAGKVKFAASCVRRQRWSGIEHKLQQVFSTCSERA